MHPAPDRLSFSLSDNQGNPPVRADQTQNISQTYRPTGALSQAVNRLRVQRLTQNVIVWVPCQNHGKCAVRSTK